MVTVSQGHAGQEGGESDDRSVAELRAMNALFIHNFVTNDFRSHDRITHPDFVAISTLGEREPKRRYIERWAHGFDPDVITYWDYRDESIAVFGSVALVRSTNKHVIVHDGEEQTGMTTYTDTYVRDADGWTCVQAQLTTVAPQHWPSDDTIVKRYVRGRLQT